MKKEKCIQLLLSGLPFVSTSAATQLPKEKPNIVVILADDLGTNELSCYGGKNVSTPNIDRLASEGIRFTNNYASCAMSVPIRASLYTGLYPVRHGSYQNHKPSYNRIKSVTHYLSDLGYRVGRTGKDHPASQPAVYGFEKIDGFTVDCVSPTANYTTNGITEFIQRNDSEPFCLFVCSIHSHMPWTWGDASQFDPHTVILPPNTVDNEKTRTEYCKYLAEIKELDNEVGSVLKVLETSGNLDNTLILFLGEQGPQLPFGKWTCYRYGQNSAFIARYPAKIEQGKVTDALVQYEDILPTLIEFADGMPVEELDGSSCLDVLSGKKDEHREWAYGIHNNIPEGTAYPVRSIQDKRYKLIVNLKPDADYYEKHMMNPNDAGSIWTSWMSSAQTDDRAAFLTERFLQRPEIELYDLLEDTWELNNRANLPEHAERITLMKAKLEQWMEEQGDRGILMDVDNPEDPALKPPVAIGSVEDMERYMRNDLNGNYYLTNDIDIPENTEWIPIGAAGATDSDPLRFSGILDGKGYSIRNLKISTESNFKGLFGRIDHAEIRNLSLTDVSIKGKAPSGGIAGAMIGESKIERVSVSGTIVSDTEAGGIAGRVARDANHPGYNIIHDCYVTASVTATARSTDMNVPSCAAGIVAFVHSATGNSMAKIDIRRVYVTGAITSEQKEHIAGNAAGILAFYDNHQYIKMEEVIVVPDTIGAATSNLFFCRRGAAYADFELFDKVYARTGITLNYLNSNDRGRGGEIPDGIIHYNPAGTYKTRQFYDDNLTWDFENTWTMTEGEYPTLRKEVIATSASPAESGEPAFQSSERIREATLSNVSGRRIAVRILPDNERAITSGLEKGIYLLTLQYGRGAVTKKIIIH
ncbi:MAG: sulfatase-like hydrolase/transferase [Tannerella sp.]|jgi:uncharacterized sulfatase|nr:sulfatase-like hydrolase/transferase [Tannerella sp.]